MSNWMRLKHFNLLQGWLDQAVVLWLFTDIDLWKQHRLVPITWKCRGNQWLYLFLLGLKKWFEKRKWKVFKILNETEFSNTLGLSCLFVCTGVFVAWSHHFTTWSLLESCHLYLTCWQNFAKIMQIVCSSEQKLSVRPHVKFCCKLFAQSADSSLLLWLCCSSTTNKLTSSPPADVNQILQCRLGLTSLSHLWARCLLPFLEYEGIHIFFLAVVVLCSVQSFAQL